MKKSNEYCTFLERLMTYISLFVHQLMSVKRTKSSLLNFIVFGQRNLGLSSILIFISNSIINKIQNLHQSFHTLSPKPFEFPLRLSLEV
jgi:hypothetical protein